jgi:predicted peptidase
MKRLFMLLVCCSSFSLAAPDTTDADGRQATHFLKSGDTVLCGYLVYLPEEYSTSAKEWPLLFFLHGSGEAGIAPDTLRRHGIPRLIDHGLRLPAVVVSPQSNPAGPPWNWPTDTLDILFKFITNRYRIDTSRVYLSGLSYGGHGVWQWAIAHPQRFAALAPLCGWADTIQAARLTNVPIWEFHGIRDSIVPVLAAQALERVIRNAGGTIAFTCYPNLGHSIWRETYGNKELFEWMFRQQRNQMSRTH